MPIKDSGDGDIFPVVAESDGSFPSEQDVKKISGALWDLATKMGFGRAPLGWPQLSDYMSLFFLARWEAHETAARKKISVEAAWSKLRKRVVQNVDDVIKSPFKYSRHMDTKFRQAFAIAAIDHPINKKARFTAATSIVMQEADARTKDAWLAYNLYSPVSFDAVMSETFGEMDYDEGEPADLYQITPDSTSTGRDPSYEQLSLEHLVFTEEAGLTERQKDICEFLLYENLSNVEIGERLGISEYTVRVEKKAIKLSGIAKGWLPDIDKLDEGDDGRCQVAT